MCLCVWMWNPILSLFMQQQQEIMYNCAGQKKDQSSSGNDGFENTSVFLHQRWPHEILNDIWSRIR